jgi:hypothetical protein
VGEQTFIREFESCRLPEEGFQHRDHVRLAWLYLRQGSVLAALARFSEGLKRFAAAKGKAGLYHETITWAYILLINERMQRTGRDATWEEFVAANPDLFDWKNSILKLYYRDETLKSDLARKVFLLPDQDGARASD